MNIDEQDMCCQTHEVHEESVKLAREHMQSDDVLFDVADFFKCLGDSTRIRILSSLRDEEMCVCDLSELLGMTDSAISHQLKSLKDAKLVKNRREGKNVYYSLEDEHIEMILKVAVEHVCE